MEFFNTLKSITQNQATRNMVKYITNKVENQATRNMSQFSFFFIIFKIFVQTPNFQN